MSYESQGKPLLTIADAIEAGSYFENPGAKVVQVGDAKGKFTYSTYRALLRTCCVHTVWWVVHVHVHSHVVSGRLCVSYRCDCQVCTPSEGHHFL